MNSTVRKITHRIRAKQRGWVFTPKDFLNMGARATIDQALSRLARQGMIRRLGRGVYDYPKQHAALGMLSPNVDSLAQAAASQSGGKAFPSGAMAAHILGLSTQVPANPVYLTNGASRTKKIAGRTIVLKHARVPLLDRLSANANFTLQALSYLGKDSIDNQMILLCANKLADQDVRSLATAAAQVPSWMADVILKIQQTKYGHIRNKT